MNKQKTIHEVLSWASLFLQTNGCEASGALLLLEHHLKWDRSTIYMNLQTDVSHEDQQAIERDVRAHAETGIPFQHLIGSTEFFGRDFNVNADVLIPRFETEELVAEALRIIQRSGERITSIVDVGTGSGVIATSIACEQKRMNVYATDISEAALRVAKGNMKKHNASITCFQGNFVQPLIDHQVKVQMIVSNPPYIAHEERETLSKTVSTYDPELALFAENEGLAAYETIVKQASDILDFGGILLFEIGFTQGEAVKKIIQQMFPTSEVDILQGINGKDRIVRAYT